MVYRNEAADAGRKGSGAGTQTMRELGFQYEMPQAKGHWLPAYWGGTDGMGKTRQEWDPDFGNAGNEVGNDFDGDYDDNQPYPTQS